jgi:hypothetical protein
LAHRITAGSQFPEDLSGYAHSLPRAQLSIHRAVPSNDPGLKRVPTDINVPVFAAVLNGALSLYDETIGYVFSRAGFPPIVWNEAKRGAGTSE